MKMLQQAGISWSHHHLARSNCRSYIPLQLLHHKRSAKQVHRPSVCCSSSCSSGSSSATSSLSTERSLKLSGLFGPQTQRCKQRCRGSLSDQMYGEAADEYVGPQLVPLENGAAGGLGGTSEEVFGPLAALLVGFTHSQVDKFRLVMNAMEADMVKIISCSNAMLEGTLQEALNAPNPVYEQLPSHFPRTILLSGMYSGEVMEVISAYRDEGLPGTVFAAAVPKNIDSNLRSLLNEVHDDHEYMMEQEKVRQPM